MSELKPKTICVNDELWRHFRAKCELKKITNAEAINAAINLWLNQKTIKNNTEFLRLLSNIQSELSKI